MGRLATIVVPVELPREAVAERDPERVAAELRELWAVEQVRRRRCGVARGARMAGLPQAAFMQLLGSHGVPVIDYDADELSEELRILGGQ